MTDETPIFEQIPNGQYFRPANDAARELVRTYGNGKTVSELGLRRIAAEEGVTPDVRYFVSKADRARLTDGG